MEFHGRMLYVLSWFSCQVISSFHSRFQTCQHIPRVYARNRPQINSTVISRKRVLFCLSLVWHACEQCLCITPQFVPNACYLATQLRSVHSTMSTCKRATRTNQVALRNSAAQHAAATSPTCIMCFTLASQTAL